MADGSGEPLTRDRIEAALVGLEDRDAAAVTEFYAEDAVFIDPLYPKPEYRGPEAIRAAIEWARENVVDQPGFTIRNAWEDEDERSLAVEVDSHHTAHDGTVREFRQVFVVESDAGEVTRWQTYLPYPPSTGE
jgi:ketosteroid isomerase-like protein